jgi:hypothetical protein
MGNPKLGLCRLAAAILGFITQKGYFDVSLHNFKVESYIEESENRSLNLHRCALILSSHV